MGTLGMVKDNGDGTYRVILTHGASTGSDTIDIMVNGVLLTPSVTVTW